MNAWVEQYLRAWVKGRQNNWARMLPLAEYSHNSWLHNSTRKSPHELLFGMKPQVHVKFLPKDTPSALERVIQLQEVRAHAQKLLEHIQKQKVDRKIMEMKVKDLVWLEGRNLHVRGSRKLLPKRYGPFKITDKIGPVAY
jgi:hypothetical protein